MKRLLLALLFLATWLDAAETPAVSDPAGLLPPGVARGMETKLAAFERDTGVRLLIEFRDASPTEEEDKVPGAFMHALAQRLGVAERGVLAVYFADEPDWRLWIGDALTERFAGRKGTVAELTANKAIHDAKEAVFAATKARADAAEKDAKSRAHLAAEAGALLEELAARLRR